MKEELSVEELFEKKKGQLAELGMAMLEDPESNIRSLNDMLGISNDKDQKVVKLGLMSLLAVFKDIIPRYLAVYFFYVPFIRKNKFSYIPSQIPKYLSYIFVISLYCSYRIRQLTEKELAVEVSKEVKKTRYYEYTLIRCYKVLFWIPSYPSGTVLEQLSHLF